MTSTTLYSAEIGVFLEFFGNLERSWTDLGNTARLVLAILGAEFVFGVCVMAFVVLKRRRLLYTAWICGLPVLTALIGFGCAFWGFGSGIESLNAQYRFFEIAQKARLVEIGLVISAILFAMNSLAFYRRKE